MTEYSVFMRELVFNVEQEEDGGYSAAAEGELIFTQGDTLRSFVQTYRKR